MIERHELVAGVHEGDLLVGVNLLQIGGHLDADGAAAHDGDGRGVLEALLVALQVLHGQGLVVVQHGARGAQLGARRHDEVVEGDLAHALPVAVEDHAVLVQRRHARPHHIVASWVRRRREGARVRDEGLVFVCGQDGEPRLFLANSLY